MTTTTDAPTHDEPDDEAIEEAWSEDPGVPGFFATVDHKRIGIRYLVTSFAFFFIAGASIGVAGTLIGFGIGVLFCANIENIRQFLSKITGTTLFDPTIYFLSRMPAQMDPGEVTAVVIMALTLTFLATLYPSWRAAKLDPVEALRYE